MTGWLGPDCKPTCRTFGGHAYDCPNHPGRTMPPRHCQTCTCPKEQR